MAAASTWPATNRTRSWKWTPGNGNWCAGFPRGMASTILASLQTGNFCSRRTSGTRRFPFLMPRAERNLPGCRRNARWCTEWSSRRTISMPSLPWKASENSPAPSKWWIWKPGKSWRRLTLRRKPPASIFGRWSSALTPLLERRIGGHRIGFRLAEANDPQPGMHVVDVDEALVGKSAPGEGEVRPKALGIAAPEMSDFPPLVVWLAAKFAGNIQHPRSSIVVAHVKHVVHYPDVVRAAFGHAVRRHFARIGEIADVEHVSDAADRDAVLGGNIKARREYFVANEQVILVAENSVRSGKPAGAVQFVVIEAIGGDELRMFGTPAFDAVTNIENYGAIAPVSEIRQPVDDLHVVEIAARHGEAAAFFLGNRNAHLPGTFHLPSRHFLGIFHVCEIDHAQGAGGVVGEIHIVRVDVGAVDAAGNSGRVFREDLGMERVGGVQKNDAVLAAGRAFAGDDADLAIGCDADVVDKPRIYFERIGALRMRGIGDIENVDLVADAGEISVVVPDPFFGKLIVFRHDVADDFGFAADIPGSNHDAGGSQAIANGGFEGVGAGTLGDEGTVGQDLRSRILHGPRDFSRDCRAFLVLCSEVQNVAGLRAGGCGRDFETCKGILDDANGSFTGGAIAGGVNLGVAGLECVHLARRVNRGNRRILRSPGQGNIGARIGVGIARRRGQEMRGSRRERRGRCRYFDARDVRPADGDMRVADLLSNHGFDGNFARLHKSDFPSGFGGGGIKGRRIPVLDRIRKRLAIGVLDDGFELELGADSSR